MAFISPIPSTSFLSVASHRHTCLCARPLPNATSRCVIRATIEQEVSQKLKEAMKQKDTAGLRAYRGIRAAFLTALKEAGAADSLPDDVAIAQLRKLSKMRNESITMFRTGGRDDLADAEQAELDIIEQWLPKLADREQTVAWATEAISKTGASKPSEMGKVMGYVSNSSPVVPWLKHFNLSRQYVIFFDTIANYSYTSDTLHLSSALMREHKGEVDGNLVREIVTDLLSA